MGQPKEQQLYRTALPSVPGLGGKLRGVCARIQSGRGLSAPSSSVSSVESFSIEIRKAKAVLLEGKSLADQASPGQALTSKREQQTWGGVGRHLVSKEGMAGLSRLSLDWKVTESPLPWGGNTTGCADNT